jgi:ubiquinone/menaquinone biosynthesis C-methylase UbiE
MAPKHCDGNEPFSYKHTSHLLNPLRRLFLSPGKLVKRLELKRNSIVLEIGSGPGYFSVEVARAVPEGMLLLVDIQPEMLNMAGHRLGKKGISNVRYLVGNANALQLAEQSCDVVFLVSVLGEVADKPGCLREIHRVLRPDGLLSITEQPHDRHSLPMSEVLEMAGEDGFRFEKSFGRGQNFTVNFRKSAACIVCN